MWSKYYGILPPSGNWGHDSSNWRLIQLSVRHCYSQLCRCFCKHNAHSLNFLSPGCENSPWQQTAVCFACVSLHINYVTPGKRQSGCVRLCVYLGEIYKTVTEERERDNVHWIWACLDSMCAHALISISLQQLAFQDGWAIANLIISVRACISVFA